MPNGLWSGIGLLDFEEIQQLDNEQSEKTQ